MNRGNNFPKVFERLYGHVVVAEGNVEIHIAGRFNVALWAWTYRAEFDLATVETQCPRHDANFSLRGCTPAVTQRQPKNVDFTKRLTRCLGSAVCYRMDCNSLLQIVFYEFGSGLEVLLVRVPKAVIVSIFPACVTNGWVSSVFQ